MRFVLCVLLAIGLVYATDSRADDQRTSGRAVTGQIPFPQNLFATEPYAEFLPERSNFDPHHEHPAQWQGQEWQPQSWAGSGWTAEHTLDKLFESDVFKAQYIRGERKPAFFYFKKAEDIKRSKQKTAIPVLVVGPQFYKLSDLDQIRSVTLAVNHAGLFERGYPVIEVQDWYNKKVVGTYTARGLQMR